MHPTRRVDPRIGSRPAALLALLAAACGPGPAERCGAIDQARTYHALDSSATVAAAGAAVDSAEAYAARVTPPGGPAPAWLPDSLEAIRVRVMRRARGGAGEATPALRPSDLAWAAEHCDGSRPR